jgi:hypothetical protein
VTARGPKPARTARPAGRRTSDSAEPQPADTAPASGEFVPLAGLAVAPGSHRPELLRTGLQALAVRPKLLVGHADDPAEVEADALADAVVHRMRQAGPPDSSRPVEEVLGALRRTPSNPPAPSGSQPAAGTGRIGHAGGEVSGDTEQALRAASSSGTPLAPALRREYEDAFGADFSAVRVHSGPASAELNAALGARAFTLGPDIYFGDRVPGAATAADRHLLAHELAHTLQDGGTAHRAVLRRLAVQITPSRVAFEEESGHDPGAAPTGLDETGIDEDMAETPAVLDPHPMPSSHPSAVAQPLATEDHDMLGEDAKDLLAMVPEYDEAPQDELFIEEVAIVGRPAPLFSGSMGDHMTAFVISRKGVENAIANQPFTVAVSELKEMVAEMAKLPGWGLVDSLKPAEEEAEAPALAGPDHPVEAKQPELPATGSVGLMTTTTLEPAAALGSPTMSATALEPGSGEPGPDEEKAAAPYRRASHYARFVEAKHTLETCQVLLDTADTDDLKIVRLQDYIAAYLELRELVPLSVSDWKGANRSRGGKGDGESGLPGFLADPETNPQPPGQLRRDFVSTIATYRMAQAAIEPDPEALAVLMPGLDPALSADERTDLMARQHVQSVLTNFPLNFGPLAVDILLAEGRARARAAEKAEIKKAEATKGKLGKGKAPAKRKARAASSSEFEDEVKEAVKEAVEEAEEAKEAEQPERTPDENFAIIKNHLVRLVRMRYAEAAAVELKHQQKVMELHPEDEMGAAAARHAKALTSYLAKGPASSSGSDDHVEKRNRDSETDVVDDVYGTLTAAEAKRVYTGRDIYQDTKKKSSSGAELAVQVVLDDTGAVRDAVVERQGRYTKGAHTLPWMQWLLWLTADIKGKQPDEALAVFHRTTVPKVRQWLHGGTTPPELGLATVPVETMVDLGLAEVPVGAEESKEDEPEVLPAGTMPMIELQAAIVEMLDEITDAPDSSVLDATDTGGKGEAYYRAELAAYERGEREIAPEELVRYILALCDVGEADTDLAERTVEKVLKMALKEYPKAYLASGILGYSLTDLADRASLGKEGAYESEPDEDSESDSDEEKQPKKKKQRKSSTGNGK